MSSPHRRVRGIVDQPLALGARWEPRGEAMYTLYSMQRSGNSYKVRLALAQLGIDYQLVEVDILKGESRTPEFLAKNPNGQVPLLEVDARPLHRRIERHPLVCRGRHAARAGRSHRSRRDAAVDVLRAAQPRAQYRRRVFLAGAGQGRPRVAAARARGLDGARLPFARRDGEPSPAPRLLRGRPLHDRRHRALRLHASGASVRFQPRRRSRRSATGSIASRPSPAMSP